MRKHVAIATAAVLAAGVSAAGLNALHAESPGTQPSDRLAGVSATTGTIIQIDPVGMAISVDGVTYTLADHLSTEDLEVGDEVTVRYEESDVPGHYIAIDLETGDTAEAAVDTSPGQVAAEEVEEGLVTPGEATGLLQQVDAAGGIIVVDGVHYVLDDSINAADLEPGGLVTVSFEEDALGTGLRATEVVPATD